MGGCPQPRSSDRAFLGVARHGQPWPDWPGGGGPAVGQAGHHRRKRILALHPVLCQQLGQRHQGGETLETGKSRSGESGRFLRGWLGHDTRISGEVYRTATGIAVTARAGANGATFTGAEGDLDALVQKSAEHVFESTQPYRYANYLDRNYDPKGAAQRVAKATQIYRKLIAGDDRKEQAWAWNGLATVQFNFYEDNRKSSWYYHKSLATDPDFTLGYYALSARNGPMGQEEDNFRNTSEYIRRAEQGTPELNPRYANSALTQAKGRTWYTVGDFAAAIPILVEGAERTDSFSVLGRGNFIGFALSGMVRVHDLRAMRAYLKTLGWTHIPYAETSFWYAIESGDWHGVLVQEPSMNAPVDLRRSPLVRRGATVGDFNPGAWPYIAYAHARTGDFAGAERLLAPLADDNATAVRMHAMIAELKGEHARADWWFARSGVADAVHTANRFVVGPGVARARPAGCGNREVQAR